MVYTEKNIYGFKFLELSIDLTPEDFEVEIAIPKKKYLSDMGITDNKISTTIYIDMKDVNLEDEIIDFKRHQLGQGARTKFQIRHVISLPFNNKGRNSQKKVDLYNETLEELKTLVNKVDPNDLITELINNLNKMIEEKNKEVNDRMIKHFSKISNYNFNDSKVIKEKERELQKMRDLIKIEEEKLKELKIIEIKNDIKEVLKFSEVQKKDIIKNLGKNEENIFTLS